jgi:hypothetical protein
MADETIRIKLVSEAGQYIGEMRLAAKATTALGKSVDSVEGKQDKLDKTTKKTTQSIERAKSAAQALGGRYGELAGRAEAAAKAAGPLGVAVGAAALALTAGAAAATKMVTEAIALTRHLGEITDRADELALVGSGLDEEDVALVEDANDALDRLQGTFDRLLVTVAGSTGFVGAMVDAADAVNGVALALDNLDQAQRPATKATIENVNGIRDFVLAYTGVTPVLRAAGKALELVSDSTADLVDEQKAAAEEAQNLADIEATEAERQAMEAKVAEARAKDDRQRREKAAAEQRKRDEEEAARVARLQQKIRDEYTKTAEHKIATEEAWAEAFAVIGERIAAQQQEELEYAQHLADLRLEAAEMVASGLADIGEGILSDQVARMEREADLLEEQGRGAAHIRKRAFVVQKAADLAGAVTSTALAITRAAAQDGGTGILSIPTAALGAAQIAIIAAQPPPPSFHLGSRAGDMAPDEVQARLTRGEAVLTRQAQTALGLDSTGIADANAGVGGDRPIVMVYQHDRVSARYHRDAAKLAQLGAAPGRRVGRREKF